MGVGRTTIIPMTFFEVANAVEGLLWLTIALVLLVAVPRRGPYRAIRATAALTFSLFGLSDWIEIHTGHWAHPWPLMVFKAGCVVSLVGHYVWYRSLRNRVGAAAACDS